MRHTLTFALLLAGFAWSGHVLAVVNDPDDIGPCQPGEAGCGGITTPTPPTVIGTPTPPTGTTVTTPVTAVPEPGTYALFAVGVVAMLGALRRRRVAQG